MVVEASCPGDVFHLQGLIKIEEIMDGAKYREILEGNLFHSSRDLRLGQRFTFQQDNGPKHTAKATLEWFKGKHWNVLVWPSQSPDLQSNWESVVWLKDWCTPAEPIQLEGAGTVLLEEWAKIPVARCAKLMETYPKRLKAVIAAKAGSTKCWGRWIVMHTQVLFFLSYFLFHKKYFASSKCCVNQMINSPKNIF